MSVKRERVSVVCVFEGKILCFVAIDPKSGQRFYFLPGGEIEPGESEIACGMRETMEETGYKVRLESESRLTKEYAFFWNGKEYDCVTHFYRGHLDEVFHIPHPVSDQDYNKGPVWIPTGKIHALFEYSKTIHDAVEALID